MFTFYLNSFSHLVTWNVWYFLLCNKEKTVGNKFSKTDEANIKNQGGCFHFEFFFSYFSLISDVFSQSLFKKLKIQNTALQVPKLGPGYERAQWTNDAVVDNDSTPLKSSEDLVLCFTDLLVQLSLCHSRLVVLNSLAPWARCTHLRAGSDPLPRSSRPPHPVLNSGIGPQGSVPLLPGSAQQDQVLCWIPGETHTLDDTVLGFGSGPWTRGLSTPILGNLPCYPALFPSISDFISALVKKFKTASFCTSPNTWWPESISVWWLFSSLCEMSFGSYRTPYHRNHENCSCLTHVKLILQLGNWQVTDYKMCSLC